MKITFSLTKGLSDVVGKPVYEGGDPTNIYGKIVSYDVLTGEAVAEMDEEKLKDSKWYPVAGKDVGKI